MEEQLTTSEINYDLFISYSNDPDYQLSRKIEAFLESFHKLKTPKDVKLKVLSVCRDGSDFSLHSIKKQAAEKRQCDDFVEDVLMQYLKRSQYLLVLCSRKASQSKYVQLEIDWFIKNKGIDYVLLAVTEGNNLREEETAIFSEQIIRNKLHTKIFYDLRGFKKESKQWQKVRDQEEELTNVAAFLNEETSGRILPLWRRDERKKLKRQRYIGTAAALVFLVLAIIAFFQRQAAVKQKEIVQNQLTRNYWNSGFTARAQNNYLDAFHFTAEAVASSNDNGLTKNLLLDIEEFLPITRLECILFHGNTISSAVFSPDGKMILTGSKDDHTARLWEVATGKQIGPDMVHGRMLDEQFMAVFSPDGKQVLTSGTDTTACFWDVATGKQSRAFSYKKDSLDGSTFNIIQEAFFSPDGEMMITRAGWTICLWNVRTGKQIGHHIKQTNNHNYGLITVFSSDGKQFVTAGDTTMRLWNTATGEQVGADMNHSGGGRLNSVVFSKDGKYIVTASDSRAPSLWDAATTTLVNTPMGKNDNVVYSALFSNDGKQIVTTNLDSTTRIYDGVTGIPTGIIIKSGKYMFRALFSPDGKKILTYGVDYISLWDAASGMPLGPPMKNGESLTNVACSADGKRVVAARDDGTVRVWDIGKIPVARHPVTSSNIRTAVLSQDEKYILATSRTNVPRIFDVETGMEVGKKLTLEDSISVIVYSPDGKQVLTVGTDVHTARVWDSKTGKQPGREMKHKGSIHSAVFSSDGKMILTIATSDTFDLSSRPQVHSGYHTNLWEARTGMQMNFPKVSVKTAIISPNGKYILTAYGETISLYNTGTGKKEMPDMIYGKGPLSYVNYTMFSPDSKLFLAVSEDQSARIWETATGNTIGITMHHPGKITTACFSSTGKYILTAGDDYTARLWEAATGSPVGPPMVHENDVKIAVFSKDEKHILTACDGGPVRLWETVTGKPIGLPIQQVASLDDAFFSPDGNNILTLGNDTMRIWNEEGDLDIPHDLFQLQARVITGCKLSTETNELELIPVNQWNKLKEEYYKKAREHFKGCKYAPYNLWARLQLR